MKTLQVSEFKKHFSTILEDVRKGEEIAISYGKEKELVAILVPVKIYQKNKRRKIGILKDKASFETTPDFKISDEELLDP